MAKKRSNSYDKGRHSSFVIREPIVSRWNLAKCVINRRGVKFGRVVVGGKEDLGCHEGFITRSTNSGLEIELVLAICMRLEANQLSKLLRQTEGLSNAGWAIRNRRLSLDLLGAAYSMAFVFLVSGPGESVRLGRVKL